MKKQTKKKLIYVRYILPPILMLLVSVAAFIPSYRYIIGGEINEKISFFNLLDSSFEAARETVFAKPNEDAANLLFSKILLGTIIVSMLLYVVAFAAAVYSAIIAMQYFVGDDDESIEKGRTFFVTLFPNRVCLMLAQSLILPLVLLPYILPILYKSIWDMTVTLTLAAPDPLIAAVLALVTEILLCIVCAPFERRFNADLFKHSKSRDISQMQEADAKSTQSTAQIHQSVQRNEEIRRLFAKDKDKDDN